MFPLVIFTGGPIKLIPAIKVDPHSDIDAPQLSFFTSNGIEDNDNCEDEDDDDDGDGEDDAKVDGGDVGLTLVQEEHVISLYTSCIISSTFSSLMGNSGEISASSSTSVKNMDKIPTMSPETDVSGDFDSSSLFMRLESWEQKRVLMEKKVRRRATNIKEFENWKASDTLA